MRIGNLEDLDKTRETQIQQEEEGLGEGGDYSKWRKLRNWWYYYKWYVVCGVIVLAIGCNVIGNAIGIWNKKPDVQIAYIGKMALPEDTVSALEAAFESIVSDFNGDGEVIVRINQYTDGVSGDDVEMAYYEYASEISLTGDISECESYFFLMDDPASFQLEFKLLASPDGSCPDNSDYSIDDKVIAWADSSVLSQMELGSYSTIISGEEISGSSQELLSGLFIGRRCFYTEDTTDNVDKCDEVWNLICNR